SVPMPPRVGRMTSMGGRTIAVEPPPLPKSSTIRWPDSGTDVGGGLSTFGSRVLAIGVCTLFGVKSMMTDLVGTMFSCTFTNSYNARNTAELNNTPATTANGTRRIDMTVSSSSRYHRPISADLPRLQEADDSTIPTS